MKLSLLIATVFLTAAVDGRAAGYCGDLSNGFGPFDYAKRSENASSFYLVESAHFPPEVERLVKGTTGPLGGDLDYTLRAIPNHPRALASLARLAIRDKTTKVAGAKYSVECYFERAMRFTPNDAGVRSVYGGYLFKLGRTEDALEQFSQALAMEPENAAVNYNLGLLYLQKKDYAKATDFAKKAETLGFPLSGLKNKLVDIGKWNDNAKK
jgi:Flp pilus assembly protein TadD